MAEDSSQSPPETPPRGRWVKLTRAYREFDTGSRAFGAGMPLSYDMFILADESGQYAYADLILPDAGRVHYTRVSPGTYLNGAVFQHTSTPTIYHGSTLTFGALDDVGGWTLTLKDGTVMLFDSQSTLGSITDRNGNTIDIDRDGNNNATGIISPSGSWIELSYDSSNRVIQAQDSAGRTVAYSYNSAGRLSQVTDANGGVTSYAYDGSGRLTSITTPTTNVLVTNQYDANNRVVLQTLADGSTYALSYTLDGNGNITATDVTDPRGYIEHITFSSSGYPLTDTHAVGQPEQQEITYIRDSSTNLLLSSTDALNRTTSYTYDSLGNVTSVTRLAGTGDAATMSFTYDPAFSNMTSRTDPLGHTWTYTYDANGRRIGVTDPLAHQATAGYNSAGQITSVTDPAGNTLHLSYADGILTSITDPLGNTSTSYTDDAGRLVLVLDPLGNQTALRYSPLDDLTSVTDALGGATFFAYDGDRNLISVTDANGNSTTYTYDGTGRRLTRTDPLRNTETYSYDGEANLTRLVDRRGKAAVYSYDGINRRTFAGFGQNGSSYESTITATWDAGNRLTEASDPIAGPIMRRYDGLDNLTDEQTPQGEVTYTYDAASRRTSMTVVGQSPVDYTWDNANRLSVIAQGTDSVSFSYDAANRRTGLALPNGIQLAYGYDQDSRVTGMTWTLGQSPVGNLTYSYDADGRIVAKSGSFAQTTLPQTAGGNTFNADNELLTFGGQQLSYDPNGNLTNDGASTYTWDARNQLAQVSGTTNGAFQYDAFGRRVSKQINGLTTQYLYDRWTPVQELNGAGAPSANLLTGTRVDEYFTRSDVANGTLNFLADRLRDTIGLADSTGSLVTRYTYDPFGVAAVTGGAPSDPNPYQFAGRENDSTGLSFHRSRYYAPGFERFISQNPIGYPAGTFNLYSYGANDAVSFADASGFSNVGFNWRHPDRYGNWCGPGYSDGMDWPPDIPFPPGFEGIPGADAVDDCCKTHDFCYDKCYRPPCARCQCERKCDVVIVKCLWQAEPSPGSGHWGWWYRSFAIETFEDLIYHGCA